ncbi:MAG: hypothetical protein ACK5PT_08945 [Cereibacter sp.]
MSGREPKLLTDGYRTAPWPFPLPVPGPMKPPTTLSSVVPPASRAAGGSAPSGADGLAPKRARFQTLHVQLVALRQNEEAVRTGTRITADQAMVRQKEVIERLCALVTVMRAAGDFHLIDGLLAQAGDASCR